MHDVVDKPREIAIHCSANRPQMILGGDREMVLFAGLTSACLAFTLATWWGILVGLIVWLASIAVLSRMGKADPLLRHVYLRHIRYASFYPAKSRLTAKPVSTPRAWR
jgi:type IV secretion system protein VirB3